MKNSNSDGSLIRLQNVSKTYGEGDLAVHALQHINFSIERGAFTVVAGPSGSGKSTLLNIISGLDRASSGRIEVGGEDITDFKEAQLSALRRQHIGFVFQSYNLLPVLTALENAEYVLMLQGMPEHERRERVMALLERVGLGGMANRFPKELSGGQQQRVAIARAIAAKPSLVLADEPTANVDSKTASALLDLMSELNETEETTFLFSTHDKAVMDRAKNLVVLKDGSIEYEGKPAHT